MESMLRRKQWLRGVSMGPRWNRRDAVSTLETGKENPGEKDVQLFDKLIVVI